MKTSKMPLKILIQAFIKNNEFNLTICNSGKWVENSDYKDGTGTGLQNVEKRLKNAYIDRYQMTINKEENIVCIQIKINKD